MTYFLIDTEIIINSKIRMKRVDQSWFPRFSSRHFLELFCLNYLLEIIYTKLLEKSKKDILWEWKYGLVRADRQTAVCITYVLSEVSLTFRCQLLL